MNESYSVAISSRMAFRCHHYGFSVFITHTHTHTRMHQFNSHFKVILVEPLAPLNGVFLRMMRQILILSHAIRISDSWRHTV